MNTDLDALRIRSLEMQQYVRELARDHRDAWPRDIVDATLNALENLDFERAEDLLVMLHTRSPSVPRCADKPGVPALQPDDIDLLQQAHRRRSDR